MTAARGRRGVRRCRAVEERKIERLGRAVSVVGLGTWQFGSAEWGYGSEYAGGDG